MSGKDCKIFLFLQKYKLFKTVIFNDASPFLVVKGDQDCLGSRSHEDGMYEWFTYKQVSFAFPIFNLNLVLSSI